MMKEISFLAFASRLFGRCFPWFAVLLLAVGCSSGGGGGGGSVGSFSFIQPHSNYALLNWTNPQLADTTEGIYKFTIRYEAVAPLTEGAVRDAIEAAGFGLGDMSDLVARAEEGLKSRILDWDEDGISRGDNCLFKANPSQSDRDRDGIGDACDSPPSSLRFVPKEDSVGIGWVNPLRPADSRGEITSFILRVTGPFEFLDEEVVLRPAGDGTGAISFNYGGRQEAYGVGSSRRRWDSWYEYNNSGLLDSLYEFGLAMTYRNSEGKEVRVDLAASHSPLGLPYLGDVVPGLNSDGDNLRDSNWDPAGLRTEDLDDDNDGILDLADPQLGSGDPAPLVSALGDEVEVAYEGTDLDLFGEGKASFYNLTSLAPGSYYTFEVRAHIRRYHNRDLAEDLGYNEGAEIKGAYWGEERVVVVARQRIPILVGANHDNDGLADALDPDDDNDGLSDVLEASGNGRDCTLVADCDGDGLSDLEEFYIDGDRARGAKPLAERSVLVDGKRRDCMLYVDCDGDGVDDGDDAFPLDATEYRDSDKDGIGDNIDNCVYLANPGQEDEENGVGDGRGDACEGNEAGQYRGSAGSLDLTVQPGADRVGFSWRNIRPSSVAANLGISGVYLGWRVYNLARNEASEKWEKAGLNRTGSANIYSARADYEIGELSSYILTRSDLPSSDPSFVWYSREDRAYEFNLTFEYGSETRAAVYGWTDLIWLLRNSDGDGYADLVDEDDDNDGLPDSAEEARCILVADCDGDGVEDGEDDLPLDRGETQDSDGDGIGDKRDNYEGTGLDQDGDGIGDIADLCPFFADAEEEGRGCRLDETVTSNLWLVPEENRLVLSWWNNQTGHSFNISFREEGTLNIQREDSLTESDLTGGSLEAGSYAHYRPKTFLLNGRRYFVELRMGLDEPGAGSVIFGSLNHRLYSAVVGQNTDGDYLADRVDPDDDNDGLADDTAEEQLRNADGTLCSLLTDCDKDGAADEVDALPLDGMGSKDRDGDGVADSVDAFADNPAEHSDRDSDGLGDNQDNCDLHYNPAQENRDGDSFGDACDADNANANDGSGNLAERIGSTRYSYEISRNEVDPLNASRMVEVTEVFSDINLRWENPTEIYLPFASQPLSYKNLKEIRVEWLEGEEPNEEQIHINDGAGFDLGFGSQNVYRISGLPPQTRYRFRVIGVYSYSAAQGSAAPQAIEAMEREVVLGELAVRTPRQTTALLPVRDFRVKSGKDGIAVSWTNPELRGNSIDLFSFWGCRLPSPADSCNLARLTTWRRSGGFDYAAEARNTVTVDERLVDRSYLYNFQVAVDYTISGEEFLSPIARAAIYPASASLPGLTNLVSRNGEEGFVLEWSEPSSEDTTRLGMAVAGYNFTVRADSAAGDILTSRFYANVAELGGRLESSDLLPAAEARAETARLYHISVAIHWTTGQVSPLRDTDQTLAAIWPNATGVTGFDARTGIDTAGTKVALKLSWTNPVATDFIRIGEGIRSYSIMACWEERPTDCTRARTVTVNAPLDETTYPTSYDFPQGAGLEYDVPYRTHIRVHWTTGQVSDMAISATAAAVERLPAADSVFNLRAIQVPEANEIELRWTNPDLSDFIRLGVMTADYIIEICRGNRCSLRQTLNGQPLTQPPTSAQASSTTLAAGSGYRARVTIRYPTGQTSATVDSTEFSVMRVAYPAVGNLRVNSGEKEIGVLWDQPEASSVGAEVIGYGLSATCRATANNDCSGGDYELFTASRQALITTADISRGVLYDISVTTFYEEEGNERQSLRNPTEVGAIYPLPALFTAPLEVLPAAGEMMARWGLLPPFRPTAFSDYFGYELGDYLFRADELTQVVTGSNYTFIVDGSDHPSFEAGRLYEVSIEARYNIGNAANGIAERELPSPSRLEAVGGAYPTTVAPLVAPPRPEMGEDSVTVRWQPAEPPEYLDDSGARRPVAANFSVHYNYSLAGYRIQWCPFTDPTSCQSEDIDSTASSFTLLASQIQNGSLTDYEMLVAVLHRRGAALVASEFLTAFDADQDGVKDPFDVDDDSDGLIEIRTAAELDAVRYQVDGSGRRMSATAPLSQSGCGDGVNITGCYGYELAADIDLSDYITTTYGDAGWLPIGESVEIDYPECVRPVGPFTSVFEGNDHTISGLRINRPTEHCIALFSLGSDGTRIRNLNLVAGRIRGGDFTGSLIGYFPREDVVISRVSATSLSIEGSVGVGGLTGGQNAASGFAGEGEPAIMGSSAVTGNIAGGFYVGGLTGDFNGYVISSFAVTGNITASGITAGLLAQPAEVVSSYAVTGDMLSSIIAGGLSGTTQDLVGFSYALFKNVNGDSRSYGLTETTADVISSYWDSSVGNVKNGTNGIPKTSSELTTPTSFVGIYADWDDGLDLDNADGDDMTDTGRDNITRYCDLDGSGAIEVNERTADNLIWDLGTTSQYPVIRCGLLSPAAQRALYSVENDELIFHFPFTAVSDLAARQLEGTHRIEVSWTNPDFAAMGVEEAAVTYRVEICRSGNCPISETVTGESLRQLRLSAENLGASRNYEARVTLIYSATRISPTIQSARFAFTRVAYPVVNDLQVTMDYDAVTLSWSAPSASSVGATVTGYRVLAICWPVANNDCSAGDYDMPASASPVVLATSDIGRGALYNVSVIVQYDDSGQARQSTSNLVTAAAILPEPAAFPAAPEAMAAAGAIMVSWQPVPLPAATAFTEHFGYRLRDYLVTADGFNQSVGGDGTRLAFAAVGGGLLEPATLYDIGVMARYQLGNPARAIARQFLSRRSVASVRGGAYPRTGAGFVSLPTVEFGSNNLVLNWDRLTRLEYIDSSGLRQSVSNDFTTAYDYEVTGYRVRFCPVAGACYEEDLGESESSFRVTAGATRDGFTFGANLRAYAIGISVLYGPDEDLLKSAFAVPLYLDDDGIAAESDIDDDGDGLIEIRTAAELDAIRYQLNGNGSRASEMAALNRMGCGNGDDITECNGYELVADIDLSDYITATYGDAGWQPIAHDTNSDIDGCQGDSFSASFAGNNHTISGLRINRPSQDCVGLFGHGPARIRDLKLSATEITGNDNTGTLLGDGSVAKLNFVTIRVAGSVKGRDKVGGLAGHALGVNIHSALVYVLGNVSGRVEVGGLLGDIVRNNFGDPDVGNISSSGAIVTRVTGERIVGGLMGAGQAWKPGSFIFDRLFAFCKEIKAERAVGGLIGDFAGAFADGEISSLSSSFAVCGKLSGVGVVGSLIGNIIRGGVLSSFAVSGREGAAPLIGDDEAAGDIENSYWDSDTSGLTGARGRTTAQLRSPTSAAGIYSQWNEDYWDFGTSSEYPALRGVPLTPAEQRTLYSVDGDGNLQLLF